MEGWETGEEGLDRTTEGGGDEEGSGALDRVLRVVVQSEGLLTTQRRERSVRDRPVFGDAVGGLVEGWEGVGGTDLCSACAWRVK